MSTPQCCTDCGLAGEPCLCPGPVDSALVKACGEWPTDATGRAVLDVTNPYVDEWGQHLGYCNSCGEEARLDGECCEEGEVVAYDDDPDPDDTLAAVGVPADQERNEQ